MTRSFLLSVSVLALALPSVALSQTPLVTVNAKAGSLTAPSVLMQQYQLNKVAGSVGFVDSESYKDRYAGTLKDVLQETPGVFVQPRYGQEVRLSIRGSGLSRGFHARGLEILQDGIPTNLADGSGDYYQIDPLSLRATEVYKGSNGLFYGASTLGGAVNFVTPTAHTATAPNIVQMEGGSFGTKRGNAQFARKMGNVDFLVSGTLTRADGYRDHSDTKGEVFNGNIGYKINPAVETRFYAGVYNVDQDLPGSLSLDDALRRPKIAAATALSGDQGRVTKTERIANRTSFTVQGGKIDVDTWMIHKDLYHPIFQVIDQNGTTHGVGTRYTGEFNLAQFRNELLLGARYFAGTNKALQFQNISGKRGAQTLDARQEASNYEAYAENRFWFLDDVALMTGIKAFHASRDYKDKGGLPLNPTEKADDTDYQGLNSKLGFMWQPDPSVQHFINITQSKDVPDFSDLTQTVSTTSSFAPLDLQKAWTLEMGTRGERGRFGWDATAYRSWVKDELLQFTTGVGVPSSTFNAGDTLHQGIELGLTYAVTPSVTLTQLWNYSDFRFVDDAQYGNNRIAGVPQHLLRSTVTYTDNSGFYITPTLDWVPAGAYADHANSLRTPGYALVGLKAGIELENGVQFYVDGRNLTDKRYISDISTIKDAATTGTSIFHPGEGRSVYAGLKYKF